MTIGSSLGSSQAKSDTPINSAVRQAYEGNFHTKPNEYD